MDALAKTLINDHRNPTVKIDISGSNKLFLKSSTPKERELIEKQQANLKNTLSHERAERRCARSQSVWLQEEQLAKVTKAIKSLTHFGYRDKTGTYLYPEETLFLMETNRLEVMINEVPLSIQEGYDLILKSCDLSKYRTYKKLVLQGYRLLRYSQIRRRLSKNVEGKTSSKDSLQSETQSVENNKKRVAVEGNDHIESKKKKLTSQLGTEDSIQESTSATSKRLQLLQINGILERLRENSPREYTRNITECTIPDYCVFLPNNKSRCDYDYNLYICKDTSFMRTDNFLTPSLVAVCSESNITFHKFSQVKLPVL